MKRHHPRVADAKTKSKRPKRDNNSVVNDLSPSEITAVVTKVFTELYSQKKGKRRAQHLGHPTPYIIKDNTGNLWANPYAFSWTRGFGQGYPTLPFKINDQSGAPKSTTTKSSWVPRLNIHCVLWRYKNGFAKVPTGQNMDISHIRDDSWLLNLDELILETGVINRSRTACHECGWHSEYRSGVIRCPHSVPCKPRLLHPHDSVFRDKTLKPLGMPIMG